MKRWTSPSAVQRVFVFNAQALKIGRRSASQPSKHGGTPVPTRIGATPVAIIRLLATGVEGPPQRALDFRRWRGASSGTRRGKYEADASANVRSRQRRKSSASDDAGRVNLQSGKRSARQSVKRGTLPRAGASSGQLRGESMS